MDPFLEIKISRYLYLESIIPDFNFYILINKNKRKLICSKIDLIQEIDRIFTLNKKINYVDRFSYIKYNFFSSLLLNFQKIFLKNLLGKTKKNIYFFSDENAYFIDFLRNKYKKLDGINLYYCPSNSSLKKLKILSDQFIKFIFKKNLKELSIFLSTDNEIFNKLSNYKISFKNNNYKYLNKKYLNYLSDQINSYILTTIYFANYLEDTLKDIKFKKSFFHAVRFPDLFTFSRTISKFNKNVFLISHGSHTIQNYQDKIDFISSKSIAIGLTYTYEKNINLLSQSIYCDQFLDSLDFKYSKINFIISKKVCPFKKNYNLKKSSKTQILYVGTVKSLGSRRYYYESSAEFIYSIFEIYNRLKIYKDSLNLRILIRDVEYEINSDILQNAFKDKTDMITISKNISLQEELYYCDCVISFSSTTMEEGLYQAKPVMCYGLSSYNHFKFYEKESTEKISEDLRKIERALKRRFISKNKSKREIDFRI